MRASSWVVLLAAAIVLLSCASSRTHGRFTPEGADSPGAAALTYANALRRDDTQGANAVVARDRRHCPTTEGTHLQLAFPIPMQGEQLQTHVVAIAHTWRVTVFSSDGDGSSSSSVPLVVVRLAGRYFVC